MPYPDFERRWNNMQVQKREEAAETAHADLARKVAELAQKDKSASEKEKSLSALTAELWAKVMSTCAKSLLACLFGVCQVMPSA